MQMTMKDEKEGAGNFPQARYYNWIILRKVLREIRKLQLSSMSMIRIV